MGRGPPAVVNGWGDTGTGPQEVQGGPRTGLLNRGNHERHGTHSVFTQVAGVYIPSGATQFTCSTACRPYAVMRGRDVRTRRRPTEVVPGGRLTYAGRGTKDGPASEAMDPMDPCCPVSAGTASSAATAGRGRRTAAGRGGATAGRGGAARGGVARGTAPGPPAHRTATGGTAAPAATAAPTATSGLDRHHDDHHDHRHEDHYSEDHPPTPLCCPGSPGCGIPFVPRAGGMPAPCATQSTLEQVQSFPAGLRP